MTIYLTTFDPDSKAPTAPSTDLNVETMAEAEALMGMEPVKRTKNTTIYAGGICLSWIKFN